MIIENIGLNYAYSMPWKTGVKLGSFYQADRMDQLPSKADKGKTGRCFPFVCKNYFLIIYVNGIL